jgi:hypothetical protein
MNGMTRFDWQAVMVIVAEPAGSSKVSDLVEPTPTIVIVDPSTVTPGDSAGAGGLLGVEAGVGPLPCGAG